MAPGRQFEARQPIIDLVGPPESFPNLRSIDIFVEAEYGNPGSYLVFPPLTHLTALVAYSVQGPVYNSYDIAPIVPQLRAIRLPENVLLFNAEAEALADAFISGTMLEQLAINASSLYTVLSERFRSMSMTHTPSSGGALRYVFWSGQSLVGPCDFRSLCRWTKARVTDPVHFALEGTYVEYSSVFTLLFSLDSSVYDCGYIANSSRLAASILPHSTVSQKLNMRFAGEDGETWFLPRCSKAFVVLLFSLGQPLNPNLVELSIHESLWAEVVYKEFPILRSLTVFIDDETLLLHEARRLLFDDSDEATTFLRIMDDPPNWVVPNLRQLRIAAFNRHPVCRSVQAMDERLHVHVHLQQPAACVPVPAEAVTAFIMTRLVDLHLPLERLVLQDIQLECSTWNQGSQCALEVRFKSTQNFAPAGWVPFVFNRDSDICEMYCEQ